MLHEFLVIIISVFIECLDSENACIGELYVSIVIRNGLIEVPSSRSLRMVENSAQFSLICINCKQTI